MSDRRTQDDWQHASCEGGVVVAVDIDGYCEVFHESGASGEIPDLGRRKREMSFIALENQSQN